jgi:hypothetical protein
MAILATQRVLTLDYWKMACDVRAGDILFDRLGNPVTVTLVQEYRAHRCHMVVFNDGLSVKGDNKLILPLEDERYRKRLRAYKQKRKFTRPLKCWTVDELLEKPLTGRENRKLYSVPAAAPLKLPFQSLPVPPFVFGFWFFNHRKDQTMQAPLQHSEFVDEKFKDAGYRVLKTRTRSATQPRFRTSPPVLQHLAPFIPTKIPNNYLLASPEQRIELLQGILHAKKNRYITKEDRFQFTSKHELLTKQVQMLAESLGCKTNLNFEPTEQKFVLSIKTRLKLMDHQTPKTIKLRQNYRFVTDIQEIQPQACVHIQTNGSDGSFLVGEGFIACH